MKAMKTFAALLALAFSLAGCGAVDGSPVRPAPGSAGQGSSTAASGADSAEPEQLVAMRQLAGENGDLAGVLYLGSVPERTTDVHAVLDSLPEQPWQFVADIPADRWVTAPGGGRELYCIFAVRREDTAHRRGIRPPLPEGACRSRPPARCTPVWRRAMRSCCLRPAFFRAWSWGVLPPLDDPPQPARPMVSASSAARSLIFFIGSPFSHPWGRERCYSSQWSAAGSTPAEKSATPSGSTGCPVLPESCGFQSSARPVLQ